MREHGRLLPRAEKIPSAPAPKPTRAMGPHRGAGERNGAVQAADARMLATLAERMTQPVQAKAAIDAGYGDLVAAARTMVVGPVVGPSAHRTISHRQPGQQGTSTLTGGMAALQMKARDEPSADNIHRHAVEGIAGSAATLPFLDQVQRSFGALDVSDIQAHIGGPATRACQGMGARAYATGNHVAFRESPDLHTAAHEAAHVVQQRAGVQLAGGIGQAGDEYEQNADRVADAVVAGRSAEALLEPHAGSAASVATKPAPTGTVMGLVQRKCAACGAGMSGSGNCASCDDESKHGALAKMEQPQAPASVQRLGEPAPAPPALPCAVAVNNPSGFVSQVNFAHDSAAITPGARATLEAFVASWHAQPDAPQVRIDGYASIEGQQTHNLALSCNRAMAVKAILTAPTSTGSPGIPAGAIDVYAHGPTSEFSGKLPGNRLAGISTATPLPAPPSPAPPSPAPPSPAPPSPAPPSPAPPSAPPTPTTCTPSAGYPPTTCGAYSAARSWLPDAYVHNATCACSVTPNDPKYNCIRKTLQDRLAATPTAVTTRAAALKADIASATTPTGIATAIAAYEYYTETVLVPRIYSDHVIAYKSCCCPGGPAAYPAWIGVTHVPLSCSAVAASIRGFGTCSGVPFVW